MSNPFEGELVLVCPRDGSVGTLYTHSEFIGAMQETFISRLGDLVPEGSSVRTAYRAVSQLHGEASFATTLADTISMLRKHGTPVDPESLVQGKHNVVAAFPEA